MKRIDESWRADDAQLLERLGWKHLESRTLASSRVVDFQEVKLTRPQSRQTAVFSRIHSRDFVNIFAITEGKDLVVVEQFRFGTLAISLETPGGIIDDGETPMQAAVRELREETGFECASMEHLVSLNPNPAIHDNTMHFFLALGARPLHSQDLDDDEVLNCSLISWDVWDRMVRAGKIKHELVACGHFFAKAHLEKI